METLSTALSQKGVDTIIFAVGSVIHSNTTAIEQTKAIYSLLNAKQKKMTKVLVDPNTGNWSHHLNPPCRKEWKLAAIDPKVFDAKE